MSRGDEIGEGLPRRGWQEPAGGYDEPDDREDRGITKPNRSGAITAVGIIAIVLGCFVLLGSVCLSVYPVVMHGMLDFAKQVNPNDPNLAKAREAVEKIPVWYLIGTAVIEFVRALGLIGGGVGVIKRSNAARMILLAMAGLGVVMFLVGTVANFAFGAMDAADPSSVAGGVFGIGCSGVLNLGFAVFVLITLLSKKNVAEFRA